MESVEQNFIFRISKNMINKINRERRRSMNAAPSQEHGISVTIKRCISSFTDITKDKSVINVNGSLGGYPSMVQSNYT
jgi:hypothetical protein